jgi:vacuolar-type H+-ATPase subunit I/STV1
MKYIKISIIILMLLALCELIFGIWNITVETSENPCLSEILIDTPYWFIVQGYLSFLVSSFMYMYLGTKIHSKCNLFVSTMLWMLIFTHLTWTIFGCDVFWRCKGDNNIHYELDRNVLWFDILLGLVLIIVHLKLMFDIHHVKTRLNYYSNDYILTYV